MHYIGVDIVEISRIKGAITRHGEKFLNRVYTGQEITLCQQRPSSLAARFAGKEAVIKAIGSEGKIINLKDIEILADTSGKPLVHLYGKARNQADSLGINKLVISLSHSKKYAVAFVLGET